METILSNGISWLSRHLPTLAFIVFLLVAAVLATMQVAGFVYSVKETQHLVNDMNTRQLPLIRAEMKEMKVEMDRRFSAMEEKLSEIDKRFDKIELQLNTIVTYIETKEGIKHK